MIISSKLHILHSIRTLSLHLSRIITWITEIIEYLQQKAPFCMAKSNFGERWKTGSDNLLGQIRGLLRGREVRIPEYGVRVLVIINLLIGLLVKSSRWHLSCHILKDLGDYHCITLNLVVLGVRYRQLEYKMCAAVKALVSIGRSIKLNPDCSTCGGCTFNTLSQHPLMPPARANILTSPAWSFRASSPSDVDPRAPSELPQRCAF